MKTDDGLIITDTHVFFYTRSPLQNFYQCAFTHALGKESFHWFFTSEQAFMWRKARFFGDDSTACKILHENLNPEMCRKLGRSVKNYDDGKWSAVRYSVFKEVLIDKFSQDERLSDFITNGRFDGRTFAEASPTDTIWGIGLGMDDDGIDDERNWKGQNLLGKCLTEVRSAIIGKRV